MIKRKMKRRNPLSLLKKLKVGDRIEIKWKDHWSGIGWRDLESVQQSESAPCLSIGYFIGISKEGDIILSGSLDPDIENINSVSYRLSNTVTDIRRVK